MILTEKVWTQPPHIIHEHLVSLQDNNRRNKIKNMLWTSPDFITVQLSIHGRRLAFMQFLHDI